MKETDASAHETGNRLAISKTDGYTGQYSHCSNSPARGDSPMLETRIACPYCNKRLKCAERVLVGDRFRCPGCQQSFNVQGKDFLMPPAQGYASPRPPTLASQALETMPAVSLPPAPMGYRPIPVTQAIAPPAPQKGG